MNLQRISKPFVALWIAILAFLFLCAAREEVIYRVTYQTKDNKIIFSTVCANYEKHSIEFRGCRSQASILFKTECAKYRNLVEAINPSPNPNDKMKMDMFCDAYANYNPLLIH